MKRHWTLGWSVALVATACIIDTDDDDDGAGEATTGGVTEDDGATVGTGTAADDGGTGTDTGTGGADTGGTGTGADTGTGTGAADETGTDTGGAAACEDYEGAASPDQVALTPRENEEAELLALEATGRVVASEPVYQRVLTDLQRIRDTQIDIAGITARPSFDPSALVLEVDDATIDAIQDGTYDAWQCPNQLYRVSAIDLDLLDSLPFLTLRFEGRFYIPALMPDYLALEGVLAAETDGFVGDGSDVCLSIEGETHYYVFDEAMNDCPAGCIDHTYSGYSVDSTGTITGFGRFSTGEPVPRWFAALGDCTQWL